jgi:hypothetical protein
VGDTEARLKPGTEVYLWFCVGEDRVPVRAKAEVARSTPDGFAVSFLSLDPRVQALLLSASPMAAALTKQG